MKGDSISEIRKAAILISSLDQESAKLLLSQLNQETSDIVLQQLRQLDNVTLGEKEDVLAEFLKTVQLVSRNNL